LTHSLSEEEKCEGLCIVASKLYDGLG